MAIHIREKKGDLEVAVRPRINWLVLFYLLFLIATIAIVIVDRVRTAENTGNSIGLPAFRFVFLSAIAVFSTYCVLRMLFGSDVVILNQTELKIQRRIFSFQLTEQSYPNSTVINLRYDEWSGGRWGTRNAVRFESAGKTVSFARQATDSDSWDLIDKMRELYAFPTEDTVAKPEAEQTRT
jgi:hypothetical protein